MGQDGKGNNVQAFPISKGTFIGTASNVNCKNSIVHFVAAGTCTFKFPDGVTKVVAGAAGFDVITSSDCETVTSTAAVMIG